MVSGYDLVEPETPLPDAALMETMTHREYLKYLVKKIKYKGGTR
jgi:hypothetical protein